MLFLIASFFLLLFILIIKNYKYKYNWVFALMLTGLVLSLSAIIIYISRLGYFEGGLLSEYDYLLLMAVSNSVTISHNSVIRLLNVGVVSFLFSIPLFVYTFFRINRYEKLHYKSKLIFLIFIPIIYIILYDPETAYWLHININKGYIINNQLRYALKLLDFAITLGLLFFLFYPVYLLIKLYNSLTISIIRKQVISIVISIILLNIFFYIFFFLGALKITYMSSDGMLQLFRLTKDRYVSLFYFNIVPIVALMIVQMMIVILTKYGFITMEQYFVKKRINRSIVKYNESLRGIFHSFKNTIFNIQVLTLQAKEDVSHPHIDRIENITEHSMRSISKVLDTLKASNVTQKLFNLNNILDQLDDEMIIPDNVTIKIEKSNYNIPVYIDFYQFRHAILNIIQNSIDAIQESWKTKGIIEIRIRKEYEWAIIEIVDNGIGIDKKNIKNIFQPFYSTKSKHDSWGVGLSYTYKVIESHSGYIMVNSEVEKYTRFQIIIPIFEVRK